MPVNLLLPECSARLNPDWFFLFLKRKIVPRLNTMLILCKDNTYKVITYSHRKLCRCSLELVYGKIKYTGHNKRCEKKPDRLNTLYHAVQIYIFNDEMTGNKG